MSSAFQQPSDSGTEDPVPDVPSVDALFDPRPEPMRANVTIDRHIVR